jgi:YD repeat-containing protein
VLGLIGTGETTNYDYDLAGLLTDVEMPDGSTLSYVYDTAHRLTEVHDGLGNKIVYTLDGMGNRTAERAYDPLGVLARTRTRVYDSLNRLSQEVGALGQATVHTYDGNGNRLTTTEPPRDSRRLQSLRGWSHDYSEAVRPGGPGAGSADGARPPGRVHHAVGGDRVDRREDRVHGAVVAPVGEAGGA